MAVRTSSVLSPRCSRGFGQAVRERPTEVKAAIAKIYPDLTRESLDLLFSSESLAWGATPLTPDDIRHEIAFVKSTGAQLPADRRTRSGGVAATALIGRR